MEEISVWQLGHVTVENVWCGWCGCPFLLVVLFETEEMGVLTEVQHEMCAWVLEFIMQKTEAPNYN